METTRRGRRDSPPRWVTACFTLGGLLLAVQVLTLLPAVRSRIGERWPGQAAVTDVLYLLPPLLVVGRVLPGRAGPAGRERAGWLLLGCGLLMYAAGNAYWITFVQDLDPEPYVTPADPMWLALYPCFCAALLLVLRSRVPNVGAATWLDGLIASACAAAFASLPFLGAMAVDPAAPPVAVLVNLAYPVADVVLAGCLVGAWAVAGWRTERMWLLLCVGMTLFTVADGLDVLELFGTDVADEWAEPLWGMGLLAISGAAWSTDSAPKRQRVTRAWAAVSLPGVLACACLGLLLFGEWRRDAQLPHATSLLASIAIAAALLRMLLTVRSVESLADARREARTDDLTDLPNRRLFVERLDRELKDRDELAPMGLALIDLDRFKEVNDSFGHHVGDRLLQLVGARLAETMGQDVVLARLGGDEFGVIMPAADTAAAHQIITGALAALRHPFQLDETALHVDASIGIAVFPCDGTDRPTLLRRADVAMYCAKATHGGFAFAVSGQHDEQSLQRLTTLEEFRTGLQRDELLLHYQPQTDLGSGRVIGVEALVRWDHPVRGLVYPDNFLPIAEDAGLMNQVTGQVLELALEQVGGWRRSGLDLTVAVNLAMADMQDVSFPLRVVDALRRHRLPAEALHLEITEGMLMKDTARAQELLTVLRALGIKLAVDDYGTGYSSLAYLHGLPVDDLKLDRAFVGHCDTDPRSAAIVESTVNLAHSLGMRMIAEGVENEAVLHLLTGYGCDVGQGYFIARPQNPDSLTPWLHRQAALGSLR